MNKQRKESLKFHIENDDYFATLATVLDLVKQNLEKNNYEKEQASILK